MTLSDEQMARLPISKGSSRPIRHDGSRHCPLPAHCKGAWWFAAPAPHAWHEGHWVPFHHAENVNWERVEVYRMRATITATHTQNMSYDEQMVRRIVREELETMFLHMLGRVGL